MKNKIYLAGGMRSGWQEEVKKSVDAIFFDPRDKEISGKLELSEYGTWDLHHIKLSDIVFGYMERTNPSGVGMAVEMGYAKGLGKTVVLVLEENNETQNDRYLQFLKKSADITYSNLQEAIEFLKLF